MSESHGVCYEIWKILIFMVFTEFLAIDNPGFEHFNQGSVMQEVLSLHEIILVEELWFGVINREKLHGQASWTSRRSCYSCT